MIASTTPQTEGNDMPQVAITGLIRIDKPRPNQGGSSVLAWFDCEVVGFALRGCALVRTTKNGLVAWPPKIEGPEGHRRSIAITDDSIRHAMMINARAVYQALGGTDADWVGKCVPQGPAPAHGVRTLPSERTHIRPDRAIAEATPDEGVLRFLGVNSDIEEATQ
jgi:hypothetical protein